MSTKRYMNRELSWLKFNARILEEAARERVPLCERLSFLSIFQTNLDEFFMVRVGTLVDQMEEDGEARDNKSNLTAGEQLAMVLEETRRLIPRKEEIYNELMGLLAEKNIRLMDFHTITEEQGAKLEEEFNSNMKLMLSPAIVGRKQPFPFLRNQDIYAVAVMRKKSAKSGKGRTKMGIISCTNSVIPRLIPVPGEEGTYVLSEELILHCIGQVFEGYTIESKSLIRLTRNADIDPDALYDEEIDYREFMADLMKRRRRLTPVRMEMSRELGVDVVSRLCEELEVSQISVFRYSMPLDLSFFSQFRDSLHGQEELFYPKRTPQKSVSFAADRPILDQIAEEDKLLCYPYDSMRPFLKMLREAAEDEDILSIRMTLYRVASQSQVIESLIDAAENGKDVQVLVELKARFDEENNIEWSRRLEEAGCHVMYGLGHYKVHSKLCLITRKSGNIPEYFTQVGTGNYNEKTARLYTDLVLMTHDQELGRNAAEFFRKLALGETMTESEHFLVAPHCLQNRLLDMIQEEAERAAAGEPAYIGLKMNSVTDKKLMDKLLEASAAGVRIDMIVRGICCLVPGIPGVSENIRVMSIVGRFLEHSRIYLFGTPERQKIYISSADFMTRNTTRRVEVACPVYDPELRERIRDIFGAMLRDNVQAWELGADGCYQRILPDGEERNTQELFYRLACEGRVIRSVLEKSDGAEEPPADGLIQQREAEAIPAASAAETESASLPAEGTAPEEPAAADVQPEEAPPVRPVRFEEAQPERASEKSGGFLSGFLRSLFGR